MLADPMAWDLIPDFATLDQGSVPVDTSLSIDYDLATLVGLFRFHPLLFFLTDPRSKRLASVLKHLIPIGSGISSGS